MDPISYIIGLVLLLFLLFIPGYFVTLAFFPRKDELSDLELLIFSFAFSISVLPLLTLAEMLIFNLLLSTILVWVNTFAIIIIFGIIWAIRARRIKTSEKVYSFFKAVPSKAEGMSLLFETYIESKLRRRSNA